MTIWIDQPIWPRHGTVFAHLISDTSLEELHSFASRAGLHPRSFHGDHYDVPQERYASALAAGAAATTGGDVVRKLAGSGLRLRKRRGDHPVGRVRGVSFPDGTLADVDLVVSDRPVGEPVFAALCLTQDADDRFAVVRSVRRKAWGAPGGAREPGESVLAAVIREVREETGLVLPEDEVVPCAYERFDPVGERRGPWLPGRGYLQVYRARVPASAPPLGFSLDDVDAARWVTRGEMEALSGQEFWWPLVPRLFG